VAPVTNPYCEVLGIRVPALDAVRDHPQANTYALLIVALLERGGPLTLTEAAERFAQAGVAPYGSALRSRPTPQEPLPLPGPEVPLTVAELDEAWREASLYGWSNQRVALSVLDAHRQPLAPAEIVACVTHRTRWHLLSEPNAKYWRRGAPVRVLEDGRALEPGHPALRHARPCAIASLSCAAGPPCGPIQPP
jgi:hypothetical protein